MKHFTILSVLVGINLAAQATTINAPSSLIGNDALSGDNAYSWGISIAEPSGQTITSATIDFSGITLSAANSTGIGYLYTDLLNSQATGVTVASDGDAVGDYWATKFSGANITALGSTKFASVGTTLSWSYVLNSAQLAALNSYLVSGVFNIGIDPDCHYNVGSISFTYTTSPAPSNVPDVATTATLLLLGLGAAELLRRRSVLARAKA
jgi:MYXO-CTERM domain-containing protein